MSRILSHINFDEPFWWGKTALTDSRLLPPNAEGFIFFALEGRQHDGHDFIESLYQKGQRCFVVARLPHNIEQYSDAEFLLTDSPLSCLQAWAAWHRRQFVPLQVLGITGSNGKTIVKEWLYQLLENDLQVVKSPKSYNSQLGVPLSVLQIRPQHRWAIFEAGISQRGEMAALAHIIAPQIGIFTNIGAAHDEGFASLEEKITEKALLFASCHSLIYCSDYPQVQQYLQKHYSQKNLISWGRGKEARILVEDLPSETASFVGVRMYWNEEIFDFQLPFSSPAPIENAIHCIVFLLYLGYKAQDIGYKIAQLRDLPMRLQWKEGINGSMLIDDTYNNDPGGLRVALAFMQQKKGQGD